MSHSLITPPVVGQNYVVDGMTVRVLDVTPAIQQCRVAFDRGDLYGWFDVSWTALVPIR